MSFAYHKAASVNDAASQAGGDAALLAGGMTLLPAIKLGLSDPRRLVDLADLGELRGITRDGDTLTIGSMTRHADVAASAEVQGAIPALAKLAGGIGDAQVRHRGTIGGSIANNDPAADYPAACLGLGATIVTTSREIAADDFFTGLFETALEEGEIITSVRFPVPEKAAYEKFVQPASRFALVGVFAAQGPAGTRVAVTGAGLSGVYRASDMEAALESDFSADAIDGITVPEDNMAADIHAAADYRAHLVKVIAGRAIAAAAG
mgnify:CR=1 FL=1